MTWQRGRPANRVPAAVARAVRHRDNDECQLRYPGCTGRYQQFDHPTNVASTGMARMDLMGVDDLQCVCRSCHNIKTQREAQAARGLAPKIIEPDHRIGQVPLPPAFRYAPQQTRG